MYDMCIFPHTVQTYQASNLNFETLHEHSYMMGSHEEGMWSIAFFVKAVCETTVGDSVCDSACMGGHCNPDCFR